jgi:hypothetical protein
MWLSKHLEQQRKFQKLEVTATTNTVLHEKLLVIKIINSLLLMEPEGSLPCTQ